MSVQQPPHFSLKDQLLWMCNASPVPPAHIPSLAEQATYAAFLSLREKSETARKKQWLATRKLVSTKKQRIFACMEGVGWFSMDEIQQNHPDIDPVQVKRIVFILVSENRVERKIGRPTLYRTR